MEFSTCLVQFASNKWVRLLLASVGLLLLGIGVSWFLDAETMITILFGVAVVLIIVFAVVLKGKIQLYGLSNDKLTLTPDKITIKGQSWEIKNIKNLVFNVDSYDGMEYRLSGGGSNISDGLKNMISFKAEGKKIQYNFYLENALQTTTLCSIFKEFYIRHTPFIEKDMYGYQTYLMQTLDKDGLEAFKLKYGYKK
jgi:hypothetical protein